MAQPGSAPRQLRLRSVDTAAHADGPKTTTNHNGEELSGRPRRVAMACSCSRTRSREARAAPPRARTHAGEMADRQNVKLPSGRGTAKRRADERPLVSAQAGQHTVIEWLAAGSASRPE